MGDVETESVEARGSCGLEPALVDRQLREALATRAARLGLDPTSIASPTPGALIARSADGALLRLDYRTYRADELAR